jgi:sortase A
MLRNHPNPPHADDTVVLAAINADETQVLPAIRPPVAPPAAGHDDDEGAPGYYGKHERITRAGNAVRTAVRTAGEIMITFGLILLLFSAYEIWGKSALVNEHQHDLDAQLNQDWGDPTVDQGAPPTPGATSTAKPLPPPAGGTIARLYIPRMNKHWVVVQGVERSDIRYAPGHYPDTALPGQVGNFSVAGHRTPAIFWDLDRVRVNDPIVVETRSKFFIYYVTQVEIVKPTAVQVVAPVPNHPGANPTTAMMTLTTCNPKWDNYQRLVVHARLDHSTPRSAGSPPEIGG